MQKLSDDVAVETRSPEETRAFAATMAGDAAPGDVLALFGELGAGKTEFVRGYAEGLGVDASAVTSPTFTIVNEYEGRMPVYHFDAYRVKGADELTALGLDEYLFGDGVCLIEWPEQVDHLLPAAAVRLRFEHTASGRRIRRLS